MISKKSSQADLEKKKPIFFLLGVSISLLVLIFAFQVKTESSTNLDLKPDFSEVETVTLLPPITYQNPSPPMPKSKSNKHLFVEMEILPTDLNLEPLSNLELGTGIRDDEPVEIPVEPIYEEPELIDLYGADKIALPNECAGLSDKEEGIECLNRWMANHIKSKINYPKSDLRIGNQGRVYVSFEISEKGEISNIQIARGVSPGLDAEAKRVVSSLPGISPAIKDGRPARMKMSIPVLFQLK